MTAAILSSHREVPPFGLDQAQPGRPGKNWVQRQDGTVESLSGCAAVPMQSSAPL